MCQVDEDEPLFMSLIADLFPGIVLDSATYAELQVAIAKQVENAVLINHPSWNLKIVQVSVQVFKNNNNICSILISMSLLCDSCIKMFFEKLRRDEFQKTTTCNSK